MNKSAIQSSINNNTIGIDKEFFMRISSLTKSIFLLSSVALMSIAPITAFASSSVTNNRVMTYSSPRALIQQNNTVRNTSPENTRQDSIAYNGDKSSNTSLNAVSQQESTQNNTTNNTDVAKNATTEKSVESAESVKESQGATNIIKTTQQIPSQASGQTNILNGFQKDSATNTWKYYVNGSPITNTWAVDNGLLYRLDANGNMNTGWFALDNAMYWLGTDGSVKTGWKQIDGKWYLFQEDGKMLIGWQRRGSEDFYLSTENTQEHPLGSMYVSEKTPDGSLVNERGAKYIPVNPYGETCVVINIPNQTVKCYVGNTLIVSDNCVTGTPGKRHTVTGKYRIKSKERNRYLRGTNSNGTKYKSYVNYWMPFYKGQGLHDASWRSKFGGTIYQKSGSHGCVNLPPSVAKKIYNNVNVGTLVVIESE